MKEKNIKYFAIPALCIFTGLLVYIFVEFGIKPKLTEGFMKFEMDSDSSQAILCEKRGHIKTTYSSRGWVGNGGEKHKDEIIDNPESTIKVTWHHSGNYIYCERCEERLDDGWEKTEEIIWKRKEEG